MDFYLVRHGDAVSAVENADRPLSPAGREDVERLAQWARQRAVNPRLIYHSGILRAVQTAAILAEHLSPFSGVKEHSGLLPESDPAMAKAELDSAPDSIMLVGHLPYMNRLAGLLIAGDPNRTVTEFAPATMLCCERERGQWKIVWKSS
jgi:phosphohistidine phosphatase